MRKVLIVNVRSMVVMNVVSIMCVMLADRRGASQKILEGSSLLA